MSLEVLAYVLLLVAARASALSPVTLGGTETTQQYEPNWASLDSRPLPSWYNDAKIGIFIHWGLFSVPSYGGGRSAGEWFWENWIGRREPWIIDYVERNYLSTFTYPDFAPDFKTELFDPQKWVELFERAGAKYVVVTSKHHEGWTNWPSPAAWNWNSYDAGSHSDLIGELANATRMYSTLKFGVYYSQFEWFHPLFLSDQANKYRTQYYVSEVAQPQLYELVTNYKPHLIWSDGDWDGNSTYWNSTHFLAWLYNDSPVKDNVVVNDRWGSDCACTHGGYYTCRKLIKDIKLHTHKWENYLSVTEGSWGYCREYEIDKYRNISLIISELVSAVSRGGNFLLNIGPASDGTIPPIMEERLLQLGSWLKINGDAIYNTTYWMYQNDTLHPATVWYTYSPTLKSVFAILLEWPADYTITLALIQPVAGSEVILMGYGPVEWEIDNEGYVVITLPFLPLDSSLRYAWTLKIDTIENY